MSKSKIVLGLEQLLTNALKVDLDDPKLTDNDKIVIATLQLWACVECKKAKMLTKRKAQAESFKSSCL